jgi:hypothetical protein
LEVAVKPVHENEDFVLFSPSIALRSDGFAKIGFAHAKLLRASVAGFVVRRYRDDKLCKVERIGAVHSEYVPRRNLVLTRGRHIDLQRLFRQPRPPRASAPLGQVWQRNRLK